MTSCSLSAGAADIMKGISSSKVSGKPVDYIFVTSMADFSIELFKKSITAKENSLISPLSVILALAMTANGADGETLTQMEQKLGGDIKLDTLNEYLYSYVQGLPSEERSTLHIANSIWFRDEERRLYIEPNFLQNNADYYGSAAYKAVFDDHTVEDINNWAKKNTDGVIDRILGEIEKEHMLFIINAITFDAEWEDMYNEWNIDKGDFIDINGEKTNIDFMHSSEYQYIDDGMATGFIKPYASGYSFAAILTSKGVSIEAYIDTLTGAGFLDMIKRARKNNIKIETYTPKFKYEYEVKMSNALAVLGMPDAFIDAKADFSRMGTSPEGNLHISEVLHKTFISVDERGAKAGAATSDIIVWKNAPAATIRLDRPFLYAIIDNATNLPVFIGTVMTL
jgi:serpin B